MPSLFIKETEAFMRTYLLLFCASFLILAGCGSKGSNPASSLNPLSQNESVHPQRPSDATAPPLMTKPTVTKPTTAQDGCNVLLLADVNNAGTLALESALTSAGYSVTKVYPEYTWNGTNPSLSGFDAVIHLNGSTYWAPLPVSAQLALVDFVRNGGGFIGAQWNGYERVVGQQTSMNDLVLQLWANAGSNNSGGGSITWTTVSGQESHPVLAGIPGSFTFNQDGHDAGDQVVYPTDPSTVLMRSPAGGPAVLVREFEDGRVVNFSVAANYSGSITLQNATIQQLYLNALNWVCGGGATNQPPTANAGADQTIDCLHGSATVTLNGSGSDPDGDALTFTWSEGGNPIATGATAQVSLGIGTHTITLTVDDGKGGTATDQVVITLVADTTPPVITLNGATSMTLECGVNAYTEPGATAVDDCDGPVAVTISGGVPDEVGTYVVTYTATDASGNTAIATRTVQVQDTTAPQITLTLNATTLWPPNHTMQLVASDIAASDLCDDSPSVSIVVTSNEPVNGTGDGDTAPDWEVVSFGSYQDVYVRAERAGNGSGRVYTITVTATDDSGNSSAQVKQVSVPHSQKKK
jgi:hypothetical protein